MKLGALPVKTAALAAAVSLSSLALVEVALRIAVPPWAFLDARTDAFWAARLSGPAASGPEAGERDVEFDPQLGWRMKRNFVSATARHDERGFRLHSGAAGRGRDPRILMLGDSMTYGFGVRDNETMAAQLQRLAGATVINAGVNGYGLDQAFLMWGLEGRRIRPRIVVLGYFVDDFYRNLLTVRGAPKPHLVSDDSTYRFAGIPVRATDARMAAAHERPSLRLLDVAASFARKAGDWLGVRDAIRAEAAARSSFLLLALRDSVTALGARLVVVLIPHCLPNEPDALSAAASIRETSIGSGIALLDLTEASALQNAFGKNCHLNARGHRLAAERLYSLLEQQGLLSGH